MTLPEELRQASRLLEAAAAEIERKQSSLNLTEAQIEAAINAWFSGVHDRSEFQTRMRSAIDAALSTQGEKP